MNHVHKIVLLVAIDNGTPSDLRCCTITKVSNALDVASFLKGLV